MLVIKSVILTELVFRYFTNGQSWQYFDGTWLFEPGPEKAHDQDICGTEACHRTAQDILDSLNLHIDPCEDFYSYACGGWIQNHPVPPENKHLDQFAILNRKLESQIREMLEEESREDEPKIVKATKKVYRACMDTERIERRGLKPLVDLLEEFNKWPMASPDWNREEFDWQKLFTDVGRKLAVNALLTISADIDPKNTSRSVLVIKEPSLGLPKYFLTYSRLTYIGLYTRFMTGAAELLTRSVGNAVSMFSIHLQSFNVIKFEKNLARIMRRVYDKGDQYNLVTVQKLQEWTNERRLLNSESRVDWMFVIKNLLGNSRRHITYDTPVVVTDWKFLEKLLSLIDVTPPRVLANYILWRVVSKMSKDLNMDMLILSSSFRNQLSSSKTQHLRWRDCVLTAKALSFVVGYMYVQRYFNEEARAKAVEVVEDIKTAFKAELAEVPWMDESTKKEALEKADVMNHFIGYPNWFDNISILEAYYGGVEVGDDHFENKIKLREFLAQKRFHNLNVEANRDEWVASPAIANAFYNPMLNSIIFPAGVLQSPFFNKDQPEALNYGSIGAVVGHEITHGFDDMGRQSDKFGNIKQWWSKETEKTYLENARCFVNQYRSYRLPELDRLFNMKVTVDGVRTLDENIADNGGLTAALRAYQMHKKRNLRDVRLPGLEDFTPEQLFYIGFARVWCKSHTQASRLEEALSYFHSPHRLRVIGSVSNSKHFATTWRCRRGSKMNPNRKCKLW